LLLLEINGLLRKLKEKEERLTPHDSAKLRKQTGQEQNTGRSIREMHCDRRYQTDQELKGIWQF